MTAGTGKPDLNVQQTQRVGHGPEAVGARPGLPGLEPVVDGAEAAGERQVPCVLLIEDDAGDALLVEELVADCEPGLSLQWARSLAEARHVLADQRPDCVLLDLHLPDSQGLDALRAVQGAAQGIAVVVLTGQAEEATGTTAVAAGAQDYLVKGKVDPASLSRAVRYAMQRKQVERSALALHASQLLAQENARLERGLLPTPLLRTPHGLQIVSRYRPGRAQALLGGDFYDVVQAADDTIHVLIGDVCGHGPDEAALGVALRIAWRTLVLSGVGEAERLRLLQQILCAERAEDHVFATVSSLSLPPDRRKVTVMRAGHPGMLVRRGEQVDWVEVPGGPALGIFDRAEWHVHELDLPECGAELTLFSDGLFEGRISARGDRLSEAGLLDAARSLGHLKTADFVDALIDHAERLSAAHGGLQDDLAVVHLSWED